MNSHQVAPVLVPAHYQPYNGNYDDRRQFDQEFRSVMSIINDSRIKTVFQPIVDMRTSEVYCYEALSRIIGESPFPGPAELFHAAQVFHLNVELEKLCRTRAVESAVRAGMDKPLCINICPSILQQFENDGAADEMFEELFSYHRDLILELTERFFVENTDHFRTTVDFFRRRGMKIAIDDLGSGFMGLKMLSELEPFIVKVSRFLVHEINLSTKKQQLLESVVSFSHKINAMVVAEGIETRKELEVVKNMKVDLGQGFFLARPSECLGECSREAKEAILQINSTGLVVPHSSYLIGSISEYVDPVNVGSPVEEVMARFKQDPSLICIPVLDRNFPVGIINRNKLYQYFGHKFGFDLYYRKAAEKIKIPCAVFDHSESLENVAKKVLEREEKSIYDEIVITKSGCYAGIVKIHKILDRITEQKINLAIQANPLTGLPGNNLITDEILKRLASNQLFAVMYVDLDFFKPFNEHFGFERGDQVIRFLGQLLKSQAREFDPESFIGHVGGDDFVIICRSRDLEVLCQSILSLFDEEIRSFHDADSLSLGYYEGRDRQGTVQNYPLLSLSIAVTSTRNRVFDSHGHLISVLSELKKKAKSMSGSSYYLDRRGL